VAHALRSLVRSASSSPRRRKLARAGCDITQFIRRAQRVHIRENPHTK
jgi:hypothetical protein